MTIQRINGVIVHPEYVAYAEQAYTRGQPFMDGVVAVLLSRGACTPAMRAEYMRMGLLDDTARNVCLTSEERSRIWDRYRVRGLRRQVYRLRAWRAYQRAMKDGTP